MNLKGVWRFVVVVAVVGLLAACSDEKKGTSAKENDMAKLQGIWQGAIEVPNHPLPIQVEFGKETSFLSIPSQGLSDMQISRLEFINPAVLFEVDFQGHALAFKGTLQNEKISGTFTQEGQDFPFALSKGKQEGTVDAENIVETAVTGGSMKAVLELPEGDGPFPAVVIIAGSGPTDRNGNSLAGGTNNSLKMLAENLASEGVASIRYDKRGIGMNAALNGKEEELRFEDFIADAAAWTAFLKADSRFSETGIIGHSEGSLIGMAAAEKADADRFISIAGAGRPIDEVLMEQLKPQLPDSLLKEAESIISNLKRGKRTEEVSEELQSIFRPSVQPYLASWIKFDPQEELKKLDIPVQIIAGTNDLQVPVADARALRDAKPDAELLLIENMNHVLKKAPSDQKGNLAVYSNPELPLADGLVEGIAEFIADN